MDLDAYRSAVRVAHKAIAPQRRHLSAEDIEEVIQDAVVAAWRNPDHAVTAAWWTAVKQGGRKQGVHLVVRPEVVSMDDDERRAMIALTLPSSDDPEGETVVRMTAEWLLSHLNPDERQVVEAVMYGWKQADVCRARGEHDGTTSTRYTKALRKLRVLVGSS